MMPHDVAQFPAQNIVHRHHSNYTVVYSLIYSGVKRWYFFPAVRPSERHDETLLLWESTTANSFTTSLTFRLSKKVKSITKRDIADCNRAWTYLYICDLHDCCCCYSNSNRALSKLSAEQAHCLFIVAGVASNYKHVHEWRHRLSPGSVEGVDSVVTVDIRSESL